MLTVSCFFFFFDTIGTMHVLPELLETMKVKLRTLCVGQKKKQHHLQSPK